MSEQLSELTKRIRERQAGAEDMTPESVMAALNDGSAFIVGRSATYARWAAEDAPEPGTVKGSTRSGIYPNCGECCHPGVFHSYDGSGCVAETTGARCGCTVRRVDETMPPPESADYTRGYRDGYNVGYSKAREASEWSK